MWAHMCAAVYLYTSGCACLPEWICIWVQVCGHASGLSLTYTCMHLSVGVSICACVWIYAANKQGRSWQKIIQIMPIPFRLLKPDIYLQHEPLLKVVTHTHTHMLEHGIWTTVFCSHSQKPQRDLTLDPCKVLLLFLSLLIKYLI